MKFDEEPNYAKMIALFDHLCGANLALRPINTDGAARVISQKVIRLPLLGCAHQNSHEMHGLCWLLLYLWLFMRFIEVLALQKALSLLVRLLSI
jgi:hypothetical protein